MIKNMLLIAKRPDIGVEQFHQHWREVHGPLALRISSLRRYVQSHRLRGELAGFAEVEQDGLAEVWVDDLATATSLSTDPEFTAHAGIDEPNFMERDRSVGLRCTETVLRGAHGVPGGTPDVKVAVLLRARPQAEAALDAWLDRELATTAAEVPDLRRLGLDRPATAAPFDAMVELAWPDLAAFHRGWSSPAARRLRDALAGLADPSASRAGLYEEHRLL